MYYVITYGGVAVIAKEECFVAGPFAHDEAAKLAMGIYNDMRAQGKSHAEAVAAAAATPDDPRGAAEHWLASIAWPAGKSASDEGDD